MSFGFSALSLLGRRRQEERERMSAPPRRPRPELGKLERGGAAWRVEGTPFGLWRAGWRGRRGRGERGPERGEAAPGRGEAARERAGGGPWSCVSPERRQSCAGGWVSGAALSAAPPSPRMPSGAPVRGSRSRARAARVPPGWAPGRASVERFRPPGSCFCGPQAPPGRRGLRGGIDVGGLLCAPTRPGRSLLGGQRQHEAGWTRGTLLRRRRSPIPPRLGAAPQGFGESREIGKTE